MTHILVFCLLLFGQRAERWSKHDMAFRVTHWTNGVGDGDAQNASNWSDGLPSSTTDEVMAILDGDISDTPIETGFNWHEDLGAGNRYTFWLRVMESYTQDIGSSGNPLTMHTTSAVGVAREANTGITLRGTGDVFIDAPAGNFSRCIIDKPLNGATITLSGSWTFVFNLSGDLTFSGATSAVSEILSNHGASSKTTIPVGTSITPDLLECMAGVMTNNSPIGSILKVSGGTLTQMGLIGTNDIVYIDGGELIYQPSSDPSAQTPSLYGTRGVLDLKQTPYDINFSTFVIGPDFQLRGAATVPNPLEWAAYWDLTQEWP